MTSAREEKAGFSAALKNTVSEFIWYLLEKREEHYRGRVVSKQCAFSQASDWALKVYLLILCLTKNEKIVLGKAPAYHSWKIKIPYSENSRRLPISGTQPS